MERRFFNPWGEATLALNRLPHWEQPGCTYFLSFRLGDALPENLIRQWNEERTIWLKLNPEPWSSFQDREYQRRFTGAIEQWLDRGHGACMLRSSKIRSAVASVFTKFDRDRYWQHAWVLMPNHVHLLFTIREGHTLSDLVKAWKGTSARRAGEAGAATTPFWQKDYYDRLIRDEEHFFNCARYIQRNPQKAALCDDEYTLYLGDEIRTALA